MDKEKRKRYLKEYQSQFKQVRGYVTEEQKQKLKEIVKRKNYPSENEWIRQKIEEDYDNL
nr:MAG TPA: Ribbon-helix-helix protein, copG family [Caudoviricetes sp.]